MSTSLKAYVIGGERKAVFSANIETNDGPYYMLMEDVDERSFLFCQGDDLI